MVSVINFLIIILSLFYSGNTITLNSYPDSNCSIYGKVCLKRDGKYLSPKLVKIYLQNSKSFVTPDPSGIFYFPNLRPSKYTLIGKADGFADFIVKNVIVRNDSISLVSMFSLVKDSNPKIMKCKGKRIKNVDIGSTSMIIGNINFSERKRAIIIIDDTPWTTLSDSLGNYLLDKILPGNYTIKTIAQGYHPISIYNVTVILDSIAVVNFNRMIPDIYTENVYPIEWEEGYIQK